MAIPIVPTIRVMVTFTKFEELHSENEFATPPSSPSDFAGVNGKEKESEASSSWYSWVRGPRGGASTDDGGDQGWKNDVDPFLIPPHYTWVDSNEKKRRTKAKKSKSKKGSKKQSSSKGQETPQTPDGFE